ncbi:RsmE family RNA methyltransferase [Nitrospira sp. M1]
MPVFFVSSTTIHNHRITIEGILYTHIVKSLRVRPGQLVTVCDERRTRYSIRVTDITKQALIGDVQETVLGPPQAQPSITLAQSVLKGEHMAWVIQKATELGVNTIAPIITERVQSRTGGSSMKSHRERWQRIALEAAQQSERWDYPSILNPQTFPVFLQGLSETHINLLFTEREKAIDSKRHALPINPHVLARKNIVLTIGPEGGWSQDELQKAETANMTRVTLGESILRSETAAITGLVMLQERLNHLTFKTITGYPNQSE